MTTDPDDEHGEILRRALHAEADKVIPGADGLEKIRARIGERTARRFGWQWFTVNWARPAAAVAAAAAVMCLGVTAPQAIELIQSTAGDHGPPRPGAGGSADGGQATQGLPPNARPSVSPSPSGTDAAGASGSPSPATSQGSSKCGAAAASPAPSASAAPETAASQAPPTERPCPSDSKQPPQVTTSPEPPVSPSPETPVSPDPTPPAETPTPQSAEVPGTP